MTDPIHAICNYQNNNWREYLESICLLDIFQGLFLKIEDATILGGIIKYIVWAYSAKSERIILGMDTLKNKRIIFESANLPQELYQDVVLLKDNIIVEAISKWLDFQGDEVFTQLVMLKDLKIELQHSAISAIKRGEEIDYDQKFKNAKYATELRKMIQDLEDEFIQNDSKLKDIYRQVKQEHLKKAHTTGVERFAK